MAEEPSTTAAEKDPLEPPKAEEARSHTECLKKRVWVCVCVCAPLRSSQQQLVTTHLAA